MDDITIDLDSLNNSLFPAYSRSLCKKAFRLILPIMDETTKEEFLPLVHKMFELFGTEFNREDASKIRIMVDQVAPLSKLFASPEKTDAFLKAFVDLTPPGSIMPKLLADQEAPVNPKHYLAAGIFALIILLTGVEKKLSLHNGSPDLESAAKRLEPLAENLRQFYSMLLYYDPEIENIEAKRTRMRAAQTTNRRHKEIHKAFFKFYKDNQPKWSKSESARRFYRGLSSEEQRLYTSIDHATRQLTDALRIHLKT